MRTVFLTALFKPTQHSIWSQHKHKKYKLLVRCHVLRYILNTHEIPIGIYADIDIKLALNQKKLSLIYSYLDVAIESQ